MGFIGSCIAAGAHAHEGRKTLAAGAPEPMHPHPWAMAPGPAGMMRDCHHEKHEDPLRANLLFIVSADEVRGKICPDHGICQLAPEPSRPALQFWQRACHLSDP